MKYKAEHLVMILKLLIELQMSKQRNLKNSRVSYHK